jgi:isoamylase
MMDTQAINISKLKRGEPLPLGATITDEGVNFAVFASRADAVELCLFDDAGNSEILRLALPAHTAGVWHGLLPKPWGQTGVVYGLRVQGAYDPARGLRHNPAKLLLDPYAPALRGELTWHDALRGYAGAETDNLPDTNDSARYMPKCVVVDQSFDWQGDHPPAVPWRDTVMYEVHVKGFTQLHPEVPVEHRGTYLGMAHPAVIAYLKNLGVTAVELMPVQEFVSEEFLVSKSLRNYWGYNSLAWNAPARAYATGDGRNAVTEFKTLVRALHAADIEVILDVVFNHTAEGSELGPTLSWRGLDNDAYYALQADHPRGYVNRTGCGNTVAVHHPATTQLIIDSLRYWVEQLHVDGFRFDLAPVLGRDEHQFRTDAQFFQMLRQEPALRFTKLIAEPWDIGADGYQLGHFPPGWAEWNDLYRDTMRGFWRGNPGSLGNFAERFAGSSDLFRSAGRKPTAGVNFMSCHDGFTLQDLVSYNDKHNEANLEDNRDGHSHNLSWNCGIEGATDDAAVLRLRNQQVRNLLATLLCSQGVPLLSAGDEFRRTQQGNNNAYCQDNVINWIDWSLADQHADLVKFVQQLIHLRKQAPGLRRDTFLKGARGPGNEHKDVSWRHPAGHELDAGDWHDGNARCIGVLIGQAFVDLNGETKGHLYLLCNSGDATVRFTLPVPQRDVEWRLAFDTAEEGLLDDAPLMSDACDVRGHSLLLLTDGLHERRMRPRT